MKHLHPCINAIINHGYELKHQCASLWRLDRYLNVVNGCNHMPCLSFVRLPGVIYISGLERDDCHAAIRDSFALVNSSDSEGMALAILEVILSIENASCDFVLVPEEFQLINVHVLLICQNLHVEYIDGRKQSINQTNKHSIYQTIIQSHFQ